VENTSSKTSGSDKKRGLTISKLSSVVGGILVILSLAYIGNFLWLERAKLLAWDFKASSLAFMVIGIFLYAAINLLLSSSWVILLKCFGLKVIDEPSLRSIYAVSQIAKYIPGNVAHIAGRHVMARELGPSHAVLVCSAIYEILGLCTAALAVGFIGVLVIGAEWPLAVALAIALSIYFLGLFFYPALVRKIGSELVFETLNYKNRFTALSQALVYYVIFFIAAGFVLLGIVLGFVGSISLPSIGLVLIAFSVSWIVGFITPGAPSGVGIREAIIVFMLQAPLTPAVAIVVAVVFRITTVLGDVLFLSADYYFKNRR